MDTKKPANIEKTSLPKSNSGRPKKFFEIVENLMAHAAVGIAVMAVAMLALGVGLGVTMTFGEDIIEALKNSSKDAILVYLVSWVLLLFLSVAAIFQIKEILEECGDDFHRRRANQIAIMIATVAVIFLFKQPYLDLLFPNAEVGSLLGAMLFGGAAVSGWYVWYLKRIQTYGEFFHVFLLASVTGFSWYARLTAPEPVQLVAVAFILGSLFRIAKDYLDQSPSVAHKTESSVAKKRAAN
jgi:hypothetical protein